MAAGAVAARLVAPAVIAETKEPRTIRGQTMGSRPTKYEDVVAHPSESAYQTDARKGINFRRALSCCLCSIAGPRAVDTAVFAEI